MWMNTTAGTCIVHTPPWHLETLCTMMSSISPRAMAIPQTPLMLSQKNTMRPTISPTVVVWHASMTSMAGTTPTSLTTGIPTAVTGAIPTGAPPTGAGIRPGMTPGIMATIPAGTITVGATVQDTTALFTITALLSHVTTDV